MKCELVIFDVGRTLLDKRYSPNISAQMLADIKQLQSNGIKVGVCTMRTVKHCNDIIPFDLDFYICLNGSYIICEGKTIFNSPIDYKASVTDYLAYDESTSYYTTATAKKKAITNGFLVDKIGVANIAHNVVLFDIEETQLSNYSKYNTEYWRDTKTLLLQSIDASKILGVQRVLDFYKIKNEFLYFGDGPNDLPIFKKYHNCICMGDCCLDLIPYALCQTKTCKEEGVSYALKKLGLVN